MTEVEAQKLVTMLVTAFPASMQKLTPQQQTDTHRLYRRMLVDLDSAAAAVGMERIIAMHRYPSLLPSIAEIREAALVGACGERRSAGDAWGDVRAAVGPYGAERFPAFSDPLVAFCMDRLGWKAFCQSDVSDEPSWRARFIELYDKSAADDRRDRLVRDLPAVKRARELRAGSPLAGALRLVGADGDAA